MPKLVWTIPFTKDEIEVIREMAKQLNLSPVDYIKNIVRGAIR